MQNNLNNKIPCGLSLDHYQELQRTWGGYVSFALWSDRIDDTDIIEKNINTLNPSVILVALNPTRDTSKTPWSAFHVKYPGGKGPIMRRLFSEWPFRGAYMTDIFKKIVTRDAIELEGRIQNDPSLLSTAESDFNNELRLLGQSDPAIFVLGNAAWGYWNRFPSFSRFRAKRIYHYAAKMSYNKIRGNHLNAANNLLYFGGKNEGRPNV